MKLLVISEGILEKDKYVKMFETGYIESVKDIFFRYSISDAKFFLQQELLTDQKHLDFVIADFSSDEFYQQYRELAEWMKVNSYAYSARNFQFASLPRFIMNNVMGVDRNYNSFLDLEISRLFDGLVFKPDGYDRISIYNSSLADGLDSWLDRLRSDLDNLDLDPYSDFRKVDYKIFNRRSHSFIVLSPQFIHNSKPLDYIWVGNKTKVLESTGDELLKILKTYSQNPSLRNEKSIHEFLMRYNHLLRSEDFSQSIYEQQNYHPNSRRYEEVDFINIAHNYSKSFNELFEVKLPNQRFVSKNKGHSMLRPAKNYFKQIGNKYFDYFSDPRNFNEIANRAKNKGAIIESLDFDYTILMGRTEDKMVNSAALQSFLPSLHTRVKLLTYDDLIDRHHYLHQRVKRFGL